MEFVPWVAFAALVLSVINFGKMVRGGDTNGALTQLTVWIAGIVVVMLVAQTDFADGIAFGDRPLSVLNFASQVFIGLSVGGGATTLVEFKKALDGSDSAKKPNLFTNDHPNV